MHVQRPRADFVQELEELLVPSAIIGLDDAEQLQKLSIALRQWAVDVIDRQVLEMPRLAPVRNRYLIEAVPLLIQRVGERLFVLPGFFPHLARQA